MLPDPTLLENPSPAYIRRLVDGCKGMTHEQICLYTGLKRRMLAYYLAGVYPMPLAKLRSLEALERELNQTTTEYTTAQD